MAKLTEAEELELLELEEQEALAQAALEPPQEDSTLQTAADFGRGIVAGGSLGFADELVGVASAIPAVMDGKEAFLKKYREEQKASEAAFEAARERSPVANLAGELAGGIGTGFLTGGLGAGGAATTAGKLGAKEAAKFFTKEGLKQAGKKAANVAGTTALLGAVEGAGRSEGTLGSKEMLSDVVAGGTFGGLIGGSLSGAADLGKGAVQAGKELLTEAPSPFMRQAAKAFDLGTEGKRIYSEATQVEDLSRRASKNAEDLVGKIKQADAELGKAVGESISNATTRGVTINVGPEIKQSAEDLVRYYGINPNLDLSGKVRKVLSELSERSQSNMNPEELRSYKSFLEQSLASFKGSTSPEVNQVRNNLVSLLGGIDDKLKTSIPEYRKAAQQFSEFRTKFVEPLERQGLPEGAKPDVRGSLASREPTIFKGAEKLYGSATAPGATGNIGQRILGEVTEGVDELAKTSSPASKILGTAEEFAKDTRSKADVSSIYEQVRGLGNTTSTGSGLLSQALSLGRNTAFTGANVAGEAVSKVGKNVYNMDVNAARRIGEQMLANPALKYMGEALIKGAENGNQSRINAVMFALLQKPQGRELLQDMGLAGEPDTEE